ncbi:oligoribonuclease [Ferrimonas marina]|uniref:Oligoribonuclease n=1 Tax=Ferrimonas marina TaxID=299255 RepID=A0A1M5U4G3_9GAMM|nr:oligoribonuclease [Ferrimonas marina]SHH57751.1 oligoribonuclease [Ferrimonas marina]
MDKHQCFIGVDIETGGLPGAQNADDPNIPVGMTGLQHYPILEVAIVLVDNNMKLLDEGIRVVLELTPEQADKNLSPWSKAEFQDTLIPECLLKGLPLAEAEKALLQYLDGHGIKLGNGTRYTLLGNSVEFDAAFIGHKLPTLASLFSYRLVNVSTMNELFLRYQPSVANKIKKRRAHTAMADIRETVAELDVYLKFLGAIE